MLLIDSGVFVAAADRDEPHHSDCAALLRTHTDLAVTATVIPEAAWLIETRLGPAAEVRLFALITRAVLDRGHVDIRQANQQPRSNPNSRQPRDNPARSEAQ